jgi:Pentapeptide repeats (8 copies)
MNPHMSRSPIALIVIGVVLVFQAAQVMVATPTTAAAPPVAPATICNGKFKGHLKPSAAKLTEILRQHTEWINDGGLKDPKLFNDSRRANLCEADLSGASLAATDLKSANLTGADLTGAHLSDADLTDAVFDIDLNSLPMVVPGIYAARNLKLVKFNDQQAEAVLVKLRSELKELGLRTQENQLTCAIRRSELNRKEGGIFVHSRFERTINRSAFDWTCEYGASPGRPLIGVVRLTVLFAVIYVIAQYFPGRRGGIWAVWEKDRIDKAEGGDTLRIG